MKTSKFLCVGMAALAFAACSNEEETTDNQPVAAQVSAGIEGGQTRAAGTSWDEDDQIGISCTGDGNTTYNNVPYTVSNTSSGSFTSAIPIYFQDLEEVTFSAYYPYMEDWNEADPITKEITAADQETKAQKKIDYMYASGAKASKQEPNVEFINGDDGDARFKHRMSQLNFTFQKGKDTELTNMSDFTVSGLKMLGTFNPANGEATASGSASTQDLTITVSSAPSDTYSCSLILFPQGVNDGKFNLSLTLGGQTYKTELSIPNGETALTKGNKYAYTITVNKTEITVNSSNIAGWDDGGSNTGDATM